MQRLFEDFRQFDRFQRLKKLLSVCANQVVAVKITSSTDRVRKDWYRAVALEDVVISSSNTTVPLFLLDYGMYTNSLIQNLVLLPSKLLRYPPLVKKNPNQMLCILSISSFILGISLSVKRC